MSQSSYKILFLCTGNSARSIMAEALLNKLGAGRFRAYSAGREPRGELHPRALQFLQQNHCAIDGLYSKSWDEFLDPQAPVMDMVILVCENLLTSSCPVWPGHPRIVRWGFPDPVLKIGTDEEISKAFLDVFQQIRQRVELLVSLPQIELEHLGQES